MPPSLSSALCPQVFGALFSRVSPTPANGEPSLVTFSEEVQLFTHNNYSLRWCVGMTPQKGYDFHILSNLWCTYPPFTPINLTTSGLPPPRPRPLRGPAARVPSRLLRSSAPPGGSTLCPMLWGASVLELGGTGRTGRDRAGQGGTGRRFSGIALWETFFGKTIVFCVPSHSLWT